MKCLKALVKNTHCGETNVSKKKKEKKCIRKNCSVQTLRGFFCLCGTEAEAYSYFYA